MKTCLDVIISACPHPYTVYCSCHYGLNPYATFAQHAKKYDHKNLLLVAQELELLVTNQQIGGSVLGFP